MIRSISKFFFIYLWGWRITGKVPGDKKIIAIVAPHTSWHDLFVGIFTRSILKMENRIKFLGKQELFKTPLIGWALRQLGGYPVVAPEGTRAKVNKLKTGFYYIALKAKVPIVLVGFCFKKRIVHFGEKFNPSGNIEQDMNKILNFFGSYYGKVPSKGLNHLV